MKKSWISMLVLVFTTVAVLSACSSAPSNNTPSSGGSGESTGPVTMTFFAPQGKAPMEDNEFTKFIENKFDVKLKWDLAPTDALQDRRQLLLASGDYPEVFLHGKFTTSDLQTYGSQGIFLGLNDLIAQHAPNLTKIMEEKPYFKEAITAPDGKIYALPIFNECYHCTYAQKYWINTEWLDKVGLEMPKTTDELYTVLKAFKEKDPNGNGKADEIPLTGAPNKYVWNGNIDAYLMNSFIYNDNDKYLIVNDGKVDFAANQEGWKKGLEYMHKLYSEGLIDPAAFTQNDQAVGQLGNREGDEVVGSITTALVSYLVNTYDKTITRHQHWDIVPPLKGPDGVQTTGATQSVGEFEFAITNKASEAQQIAAIEIIDYMFSEEGALYAEYGPTEGKGWQMAGADEKNINGEPAKYSYYNLPERDPNVVVNESWSQIGAHDLSNTFRNLFVEGQDPLVSEGYGTRLAQATNVYAPYAPKEVYPSNVFIRPEDTEAAAQLTTAVKDYVQTNMAQFILGNKSIEKDWDSYVKGFDGLGLSNYLAIYQRAIEKK
ncbi:ABC transporter substrate-binding protein [Paenibacillus algorifonticola]|uniref:ABC transporter substrate-binding protein n=1 Tax=Paenibacillus algorifonticola TaxID=684063 RepID=UPI003D2A03E5